MSCGQTHRLLSAFVDGELSGADMMRVREHVRNCPACSTDLDDIRLLKCALGQLRPISVSEGLEERLIEALGAAEVPVSVRIWDWLRSTLGRRLEPASAAVALCAGMLALSVGHLPQPSQWDDNVAKALAQPPPVVSTPVSRTSEGLIAASAAESEFRLPGDQVIRPVSAATLTPASAVSFSIR